MRQEFSAHSYFKKIWHGVRKIIPIDLSQKHFSKLRNALALNHYYLEFSVRLMSPTGIYLFEVNNRNSRTMWEICLNLTININDVVLVSSMLTLNRFHTLFWCFHCWLWISKCQLGQFCSVKALTIYDDCDTSHTTNKNFIIKMNFT